MIEQTNCLVQQDPDAGQEFIFLMDDMPSSVRKRLKEHEFNLCVACLNNRRDDPTNKRIPQRPINHTGLAAPCCMYV